MEETVRNRSTKAEVLHRVGVVESLLVMAFSRSDILQFSKEKAQPPWGVSEGMIDKYICAAKANLVICAATHTKKELGILLRRLEDLYRRTLGIQDYKAALAVLKERSELLGLKKQAAAVSSTDVTIHVTHRPENWDPNDPAQAETRVVFGTTPDEDPEAYSEAEEETADAVEHDR